LIPKEVSKLPTYLCRSKPVSKIRQTERRLLRMLWFSDEKSGKVEGSPTRDNRWLWSSLSCACLCFL